MKKNLVIVGVVVGVVIVVGISVLAWKTITITDPYVVKPITSTPAPVGASVGHSIGSATRTLSIVSSNDIVVVADPGASFQYEVLWLVERPRKDGTHTLMEYKCEMPQYAAAGHINPVGSQIPPKIQQVADGGQW
jgi:hypothetical protein